MASVTTSDAEIAAQPPSARRVAGGTRASASLRLLPDVPASTRRRASRLPSPSHATRATLDFFTASEGRLTLLDAATKERPLLTLPEDISRGMEAVPVLRP